MTKLFMDYQVIGPDPNYRQPSSYEYGSLREVTLSCILSQNAILWACTYRTPEGRTETCGGFSGPFEALVHALDAHKDLPWWLKFQQQEKRDQENPSA